MADLHRTLAAANRHLRQVAKVAINHEGRRDDHLRKEVFDLVRPFTPAVARESGGAWYFLSTQDFGLSRIVFGEGSYEQDVMAHTIGLAEAHTGRCPLLAGRAFVDIGANLGTSTIPALRVFGAAEAVCIEPDVQNHKFLRCNLIFNDLDDRARTLRVALSDRAGAGVLEWAEGSWGDHRVRVRSDLPDGTYKESSRPTTDVALMRLDDVVSQLELDPGRIGLVWMDVQGHEGHVLAGAPELLGGGIPWAVEYWPYGLRRAGGLGLFHEVVAASFRAVVDVRLSLAGAEGAELPASQVGSLVHRYGGESYTDLLLLP